MRPLSWVEVGANLEAAGVKGWYRIRRAPGFRGCILTAVGHDELPMLVLPPYGRAFPTVRDARMYADRIERVKAVEVQIGGE